MDSSGVFPPLIVRYDPPTAEASGVIYDIDFGERFRIEAREAGDDVIGVIIFDAGDPDTGNQTATDWAFKRHVANIHSIRFVGTRTVAGGFGLGFDNFDARNAPDVPLPAWLPGGVAAALITSAWLGLSRVGRSRGGRRQG